MLPLLLRRSPPGPLGVIRRGCLFRLISQTSFKESNFEDVETAASNTPVTRELWLNRARWDEALLASSAPQTTLVPKPPNTITINYPFTSDAQLREHYRSALGPVRVGRVLEDLDSFAGYVAFDHCDDGDPTTRPPLVVTAAVESIHFRAAQLELSKDMQMRGQVCWAGRSSLDVAMELLQGGRRVLLALFTFASRDPVTRRSQLVNPLQPATPQQRSMFEARQQVADRRRAERAAREDPLYKGSAAQREWAAALLQQGRTKSELPSLAEPRAVLMPQTQLENTLMCQPQQRNMHGRIFGGFLMRRAYELAHSTAYLFAGDRPLPVEVGEVSFQQPVEVGDLLKFRSRVLHAWQHEQDPSLGCAWVQAVAVVTKPEELHSYVTNKFNFVFKFRLRCDAQGTPIPPHQVLPTTEDAALEVARYFGPDATPTSGLEGVVLG